MHIQMHINRSLADDDPRETLSKGIDRTAVGFH